MPPKVEFNPTSE